MLQTPSVRLSYAILLFSVGATACAQNFPDRPIRIITSLPGGGSDFAARLIASGLAASMGQPVIVENRGAIIPAEITSKAQPDGYTLLLDGSSFWVAPLLQKMPYDFMRDFSPITPVTKAFNVLVVRPGLAANSVKELIALAKAKPGALNYGSSAIGSSNHLAAELFKSMAGVNIVGVSYKGTAAALVGVMNGDVQLAFPGVASAMPHVKAGRLKLLAAGSAQPSALAPGTPTISASGLPGFEAVSMDAVFGPAKMPATLIHRLNQEIARVVNSVDAKEKFLNESLEVYSITPEQFKATLKADIEKWGKVIKDAGLK